MTVISRSTAPIKRYAGHGQQLCLDLGELVEDLNGLCGQCMFLYQPV